MWECLPREAGIAGLGTQYVEPIQGLLLSRCQMNIDENIAGSGDFAIGFGEPADVAVRIATGLLMQKATDDALQAVKDVKQLAVSPIDESILEVHGLISECNSCIHGSIDNQIADIDKVVEVCNDAVKKHLNETIEDIYSRIVGIQYELPQPELGDDDVALTMAEPEKVVDADHYLKSFYDRLGDSKGDGSITVNLGDETGQTGSKPIPTDPQPGDETIGEGLWKCVDGKCVPTTDQFGMTHSQCLAVCKAIEPPPTGGGDDCIAKLDDGGPPTTVVIGDCTYHCCPKPEIIGHPSVCGELSTICQIDDNGDPLPPVVVEPTPSDPISDSIQLCLHGICEPADYFDIAKCYNTYVYYSQASQPTTKYKSAGILNCLKDGSVEFVCNGKAIWFGSPEFVGKPIGDGAGEWSHYEEVQDDDSIWHIYEQPDTSSEMIFDQLMTFSFLQFGNSKDICDAPGSPLITQPLPPVTEEPTDFCDPRYYDKYEEAYKFSNTWGESSIEGILWSVAQEIKNAESDDTSWWQWTKNLAVGTIKASFLLVMLLPFKIIKELVKLVPIPKNCQEMAIGPLWFYDKLLNNIPIISEFFPNLVKTTQHYLYNFSCQYLIPDAGTIRELYAQNHLTKEEMEFGLKMHGLCIPWQQRITEAMEEDFSVADCVALYNSGKFNDEQFRLAMNEIKWKGDDMLSNVKYLGKVVPSVSELFEGMTRDIDNPAIINSLGLNDTLDERNIGQTKEWLDRHGMTDEVLRYRWRLHWKLIDQRVVLRLYTTGQVDEKEMTEIYRYNGHPPVIAKKLAKAVVNTYWDRKAQLEGKRSFRQMQMDYFLGNISQDQFKSLLFANGCPLDQIDSRVEATDSQWNQIEFKRLLMPLRKAFMRGEVDVADYRSKLLEIGVDEESVSLFVSNDIFVRSLQDKPIVLSQMCKLVKQRYMTIAEYQSRAERLGHNKYDATLLAASCLDDVNEFEAKKHEAEMRAAEQEAKKEQQQLDKAIKAKERAAKLQRQLYLRHRTTKPKPVPSVDYPGLIPDGFGGFGTN